MRVIVRILAVAVCAALSNVGTSIAHARSETCTASWYGADFHMKNPMANGELFNMYDPTLVAHKELPFGTRIKITNLKNGRSIIAEVTDRGPFKKGRCVDVSMAGAVKLGFKNAGTTRVTVEVLG